MSGVRTIKLKNGRALYVEMEEVDIPQTLNPPVARRSDLIEGAEPVGFRDDVIDALQVLQDNIETLAETVYESLAAHQPEEWSLEVNIGFKGKTSPIPVILSGEASGAIKVTATWKRSPGKP